MFPKMSIYIDLCHSRKLVGGFNPFEKYARQIGFIFPNFRGKNKTDLSCHRLENQVPGTQMTIVLNGKGLLLEGETTPK